MANYKHFTPNGAIRLILSISGVLGVARLLVGLIIALSLTLACSSTGNYERAYFEKHGARYVVEMKGRRRLLAHDPFSAIRGGTYEDTLTLDIPRIEGVIEGSEIPVMPGKLRYAGRVEITRGKMRVELYYDDGNKVPLLWNGKYTLFEKVAGANQ